MGLMQLLQKHVQSARVMVAILERGNVMVEVALEPRDRKGVVEVINGWKGKSLVM